MRTGGRKQDAAAVGVGRAEEVSLSWRLLVSLPPEVLQHVLRKAGRRCRRACKALLAAYGPLDGPLTSLSVSVGATWDDSNLWDAATTAVVRNNLSSLKSLSVEIFLCSDFGYYDEATSLDAMIWGLAACSRIEAVHINDACNVTRHLGQLSRLQSLASLFLRTMNRTDPVSNLPESVMGALQPMTKLTKLDVLAHYLPQQPHDSWLPLSLVELRIDTSKWAPSCLLPHLRTLPALSRLTLGDPGSRPTAFWAPEAAEQLSALTQLTALSISVLTTPPAHFVRNLSGLTALRELRALISTAQWDITNPPYALRNMTDADLLHLAPLSQHLTLLELGFLTNASAPGVVSLLGAMANVQQLSLKWPRWVRSMCTYRDGEVLVQGLLPLLQHLTSLQCECVKLPQPSRDVLLAAAAAHDCRCELTENPWQ